MEVLINVNKFKTNVIAERAIPAVSAICTVLMLGWVLWYCRYGFDFTDEGFYLVWISNPFKYSVSVTEFGFIYHPLYVLLDGNIAALRQANILITFFLAWALGNIFLVTVFVDRPLERAPRLTISGAISTASLVMLSTLPSTPSYNWLALQALVIAAIGLLLADKKAAVGSILGWLLIGVGGWLAFMAKPPTAIALGLCSGFYLLMARKLSVRLLSFSFATTVGLLVLTALTVDGSIITFIDRLKEGKEAVELMGSGHDLSRLLRQHDLKLDGRAKIILIAGTAVIFSAAYLSQAKIKALLYGGTILSIAFALASMAIIFGITHKTLDDGYYRGLLLWSVPFAAILVGFALYRLKGLFQISRFQWALALTLLILPHVYAFGTNNNYWCQASHAGVFWVLAGFVLLSPIAANQKFTSLLLSFGLAVQLVVVALVQTGFESPYRQPQPLRKNDFQIEIGKPASALWLSQGFGRYVAEAIDLANQIQFKTGTPMIDLSGQSPGILYAVGASNIGQAWMIGGYPGSNELATRMLKTVSCKELSRAWLLVEPEGPRRISLGTLSSFGADLATDFEIAGTLRTAEGAGGYNKSRLQLFLKPVRSVDTAMTACAAAGRTATQ